MTGQDTAGGGGATGKGAIPKSGESTIREGNEGGGGGSARVFSIFHGGGLGDGTASTSERSLVRGVRRGYGLVGLQRSMRKSARKAAADGVRRRLATGFALRNRGE